MPRSIIETLACGRPVVTTDIPIMHELVNELNGRIVSRRDPDLLAAAVVDVYRHVARCLSPASIAATVTQYTPSQQLKCVYAVHERLNTELTAFRRKAKGMMEN
jgi:glycosyltransferase involved in cell wall biosynthesis